MTEGAVRHSLNQSLATTTFDPEDFAIAGAWLSPPFRPTADGAPAMISVGLNSDDLSYAYVALDAPGRRLVAGVWKDPDFTDSVWLDLRPAEALELGRRLLICAEAAAQFAEAFPEEPDEADGTDERLATNVGTNPDTCHVPPDQAT
jgi:hypothetical protein